jgi:hypothetical protein
MRRNFITIFLIFVCLPHYSQVISGRVFDNETKKQIPYANVFFNGTTIGTSTDNSGNFNLILPKDGKFPLAFSALGYESILLSVYSHNQSIRVFMNPKIYELDEVIIRSKMSLGDRMSRNYYLNLFKKQFLGESLNASRCKILNESDIVFQYLNNEGILKAYSKNPLIIINKALGYQITYYIDGFECSSSGDLVNLYGNYTFKEDLSLEGKEQVLAEKRRRFAYLGSRMQLFRSLWDNDFDSAGFTLKDTRDKILTYDSLVIQTDSGTKYLKRKGIINIAYLSRWNDTQINILKDSVYFNRFGYFDPYVIKWNGEMANQRIGDMLPFDYVYEKTTIK